MKKGMMKKHGDIIGNKYGRLLVIKEIEKQGNGLYKKRF